MEVTKGECNYYVMSLQSLLARLGYDTGPIDGCFGDLTENALRRFQQDRNLPADGTMNEQTIRVVESYLMGYDRYTVRQGDSLFTIAQRYGTDVNRIRTANPDIANDAIFPGQTIIVPYNLPVVYDDVEYPYEILERDLRGLRARYPFITVSSAGQSVMGRELYYVRLGNGPNEVFYNGTHHAIEWLNTPLLMLFIEEFAENYSRNQSFLGYDLANLWNEASIYIMPMVNPDGVDIVINGIQPDHPYYDRIMRWNTTGQPVEQVWKANIRGVDLNLNYPAKWERAKEIEEVFGVTGPSPVRYAGPYPLSEPETRALADFTRMHDFSTVIAYHSQGRVIFWDFCDIFVPGAREYGEEFERLTGYRLADVDPLDAYAGYKDWFIQEFRRPGYTFETGLGVNPLPVEQLPGMYQENREALLYGATIRVE